MVWGYLRQRLICYEHSLGLFLSFTLASGIFFPLNISENKATKKPGLVSHTSLVTRSHLAFHSFKSTHSRKGLGQGCTSKGRWHGPFLELCGWSRESESRKDCAGMPFLCSMAPHGTRKVGCGTGGVRESDGETVGLEVQWDWER